MSADIATEIRNSKRDPFIEWVKKHNMGYAQGGDRIQMREQPIRDLFREHGEMSAALEQAREEIQRLKGLVYEAHLNDGELTTLDCGCSVCKEIQASYRKQSL